MISEEKLKQFIKDEIHIDPKTMVNTLLDLREELPYQRWYHEESLEGAAKLLTLIFNQIYGDGLEDIGE